MLAGRPQPGMRSRVVSPDEPKPGDLWIVHTSMYHEDDVTPRDYLAFGDVVMLIRSEISPIPTTDRSDPTRKFPPNYDWFLLSHWGFRKVSEGYLTECCALMLSSSIPHE